MNSALIFLKYIWTNKTLVTFGILVLVCTSFYVYYSYASDKIFNLHLKTVELNKVIQEKNKIIESLKKDYEDILLYKDQLVSTVDNGNKEIESLRKKLFREEKNKKSLNELAKKKTSLIEKKINKSTKKVIECFETISKNGDC